MIDKIQLKFSSRGIHEKLRFKTGPITIFLGPNNSGKSLSLQEIEGWCRNGNIGNIKIISEIDFNLPTDKELDDEIDKLKIIPQPGQFINDDHILYGKISPVGEGFSQYQVHKDYLKEWKNSKPISSAFFQHYLTLFTVRLDGRSRFNLTDPQPSGDLTAPSQNHLIELMKNDSKRLEIRRIIKDAFNKCFVIDPTGMQQLKMRFSDRDPVDNYEEQALDERARKYHKQAIEIANLSDGVKAFTGCISSVLASDSKIILIDEPEAFLHPTLAFKLGKELSSLARTKNGNLFVATHSSHFVMGCIQSGVPINILRLTYSNNFPTARLLPSETLSKLMKSPMLRSTGILESLFFESVIISEGDSDRAFYNEINERLLQFSDDGIANSLFVNAQNKQTVADIIKPLRELGIPAVGIVDIDIIKDNASVWTKLLKSANVPEALHQSLHNLRNTLKTKFDASGKDMKRDGGVSVLNNPDQEAFNSFINQLAEYGVFIVYCGEAESWLKHLAAPGRKSEWLINIFDKMGDDPTVDNYVKPDNSDVWLFIKSIKKWISDIDRKGIHK